MQLLLNDDQLKTLEASRVAGMSAKQAGKQPAKEKGSQPKISQDAWNDDEDDFFGTTSGNNAAATVTVDGDEEIIDIPATTGATRGRKRKGPTGAPRGRKPGPNSKAGAKRKAKEAGADAVMAMDEGA